MILQNSSSKPLPPELFRIHTKLIKEFPYFAKKVLKIRNKEGILCPLILNTAQWQLYHSIQDQLRRKGFVRKLVLKGRKQGVSTEIGGLFYHIAITVEGRNVFILTHHADTTKTLFNLTKRYYDLSPEMLRPPVETRNRNELKFSTLDSQYTVGTAGSADIGRGGTPLLLHLSEIAFFPNEDEISTGILNSVPRSNNTYVMAESTANGARGMFYTMCMDAMDGRGDYEMVFLKWFDQEEYKASLEQTAPEDFLHSLDDEEVHLKEVYHLSLEQLNWRRLKIVELRSKRSFYQEYPMHPKEAFQMSGGSFYDPIKVAEAMERKAPIRNYAPLILGVDPAIVGDRIVLCYRRGRVLERLEVYRGGMEPMTLAGIIARGIETRGVKKAFIDVGLGYGVISRLKELGFSKVVIGVHFNSTANEPEIYANIRVEMAYKVKDWIDMEEPILPKREDLRFDLLLLPEQPPTEGKLRLTPKKELKVKYKKSPDILDALCLTFAYPVARIVKRVMSINAPSYLASTDKGLKTRTRVQTILGGRG